MIFIIFASSPDCMVLKMAIQPNLKLAELVFLVCLVIITSYGGLVQGGSGERGTLEPAGTVPFGASAFSRSFGHFILYFFWLLTLLLTFELLRESDSMTGCLIPCLDGLGLTSMGCLTILQLIVLGSSPQYPAPSVLAVQTALLLVLTLLYLVEIGLHLHRYCHPSRPTPSPTSSQTPDGSRGRLASLARRVGRLAWIKNGLVVPRKKPDEPLHNLGDKGPGGGIFNM